MQAELCEVVAQTIYKDWHITVQDLDDGSLRLRIDVLSQDTYSDVPKDRLTCHLFAVPAHGWTTTAGAQYWLFDRLMSIERHEAMELFKVDGVRVYDPHKPGRNPYQMPVDMEAM